MIGAFAGLLQVSKSENSRRLSMKLTMPVHYFSPRDLVMVVTRLTTGIYQRRQQGVHPYQKKRTGWHESILLLLSTNKKQKQNTENVFLRKNGKMQGTRNNILPATNTLHDGTLSHDKKLLPGVRTKVFTSRHSDEWRAAAVSSSICHRVSPPVQIDFRVLQTEEDEENR